MMLRVAALALVLSFSGAATSCSSGPGTSEAPDVTFKTLDDTTIRLADRRGTPTLVVFFALNNPLALDEIDRLSELTAEYADRDLELVAVARSDERPELVRTILHQKGYLSPFAMDPDNALATAFGGVTTTPAVFLVSPDGRVVFSDSGATDLAALRARIEAF